MSTPTNYVAAAYTPNPQHWSPSSDDTPTDDVAAAYTPVTDETELVELMYDGTDGTEETSLPDETTALVQYYHGQNNPDSDTLLLPAAVALLDQATPMLLGAGDDATTEEMVSSPA
jgi:hypothetical protein